VGEVHARDRDYGRRVFRLVEEIYPIESQIYARAIDRLLDLLEEQGASDDDVAQAGNEARLLLGVTLVPFIEAFTEAYLRAERPSADMVSMSAFRRLARPWALAELKHAVAYIVGLELQEYQRHSQQGGLDQHSLDTMAQLRRLIDEHGDRPEATPLVQRAAEEYQLYADRLAQHDQLNSLRPRTLSYLLSCTSRGQLRELALAALILKGNTSPGAEAAANPLQLLDVPDVATVIDLDRSKVTSGVSKLRRRAAQNPRIDIPRHDLDPHQLWRHLHLNPSAVSPTPAQEE
jgi:hypothetical protein